MNDKEKTIIFALQEEREESYFKTLDVAVKCLSKPMKIETMKISVNVIFTE
jgi:hypothetical protein